MSCISIPRTYVQCVYIQMPAQKPYTSSQPEQRIYRSFFSATDWTWDVTVPVAGRRSNALVFLTSLSISCPKAVGIERVLTSLECRTLASSELILSAGLLRISSAFAAHLTWSGLRVPLEPVKGTWVLVWSALPVDFRMFEKRRKTKSTYLPQLPPVRRFVLS